MDSLRWNVAGVYEDAGYSGKDFQRPGIQELLDDVRTGTVDVIVTYKIDRMSRSLKDFYDLWEVLKSHNVTFVSATQHFDTSDSMGMLMLNILLSFAQFERELTRERTISKMTGRAEKGLWNGGAVPLGFTYETETQTLRPDEFEGPIVRFMFQRVIETHSPCAVANEANARVNFTKDGSASACPVRQLPARDFETLIKAVLADLGTNQTILQACVDAANREAVTSVDELENALARHCDEMGRLTAAIHRLIEVMKEEDLLADDLKDEYRRLVREKEALRARCVKLELDIERRRKRVLDADLIRRSLEDFARLVELLPLEDQKELFQLLLKEVEVEPFDPAVEEPPRDGALTTRIRTRWYRVRISLYQLPGVAFVNQTGKSSDLRGTGSPGRCPVNSITQPTHG